MMTSRLITAAGLFALLASPLQIGAIPGQAQTVSNAKGIAAIPSQLWPSLDDGIRRFTEAQASGQWDEVARLMGRFRVHAQGALYTQAQKECLLSQMRAKLMISFVTDEIMFSSESLGVPAGKRWWFLNGMAEFKTLSGAIRSPARIIAYRDRGEWRFTPPNYDDEWLRDHFTEVDFSINRSANIEIALAGACPVEIHDLSVVIHREYPSERKLNFTLRNKTNKKMTGYGLHLECISIPNAGIYAGYSLTIEAKGMSRAAELTYSAYTYYCEGEAKHRLIIDSVWFADGSKWIDPRFRRS